jgi:hypothetical protein
MKEKTTVSIATFFLLITIILACQNEKQAMCNDDLLTKFDQQAAKYFLENQDKLDLSTMRPFEQCVIHDVVTKYLDRYENWRLTIVDSFYFKTYRVSDINIDFSFVSNNHGDYYFLMFPRIHEFLFGTTYYDDNHDGTRTLRDSVEFSLVKIISDMVDRFFDKEVTHTHPLNDQFQQANRLVNEMLFPDLSELDPQTFFDSLGRQPLENSQYVQDFLNPIITKSDLKMFDGNEYQILLYYSTGYIFVEYAESSGSQIAINFYYIPKKDSFKFRYGVDQVLFKECLDKL